MPVRSSSSSVFKWPDRELVARAAKTWARLAFAAHPEVERLGYHGSYARGDWGVGSDLDLVAIVDHATAPFERRALAWDLSSLPVQAEIVVYTSAEWARMRREGSAFVAQVEAHAVWLSRPAVDDA